MSIFTRTVKPRQILQALRVSSALQARQGHFFPEYKPGPLPKTEEERIKAAKKYNLLPEEYETYEEGSGHGDYPKLPFESVDSRDPWYPWDNEEFRRNYNDPVNAEITCLIPEAISTGEERPPKHIKALKSFLAFLVTGVSIYLFDKYLILVHPLAEKQFITPGVTHYTFEKDLEEAEKRKNKKRKKKKCEDEE